MADLTRVLAGLDGVQEHDGYYSARCPGTAHHRGDRRRSLSITPMPDGSIRLKCFAGCAYDTIIAAGELDRAWLRGDGQPIPFVPRAARPTVPPQPKPAGPKRVRQLGTTWYAVRDAAGVVQAYHKRVDWQLEDGSTDKAVSWWQPDRRTPGLGGRPLSSLPLYGTERLADLPPGSTAVLMEGEKAADAFNAELQRAGITTVVALGTVTGASDAPSRDVL